MKSVLYALSATLLFVGCEAQGPVNHGANPIARKEPLTEVKKGFESQFKGTVDARSPVPTPPAELFSLVNYESPIGSLPAYVTPDPQDGQKHPAIIWLTGGDCNSIGDVWTEAPIDNDQTASAFRKAGHVLMFPSLRGGNENPGRREGFFGEVDDVLAAADFLAKQPYVDPSRIYLGGHSTGATLALLVAESSDRFRAVFSFGPVSEISGYPPDHLPFDVGNPREREVRSPGFWLSSIKSPTFVIEGEYGNIEALEGMRKLNTNSQAHFVEVKGANHFNVVGPITALLAERIAKDVGPACTIALTAADANAAFQPYAPSLPAVSVPTESTAAAEPAASAETTSPIENSPPTTTEPAAESVPTSGNAPAAESASGGENPAPSETSGPAENTPAAENAPPAEATPQEAPAPDASAE